jgi:DNA-binding transcriptional LysR family regulator
MQLRHLRYFVAVAEELHFGRAAERLHVSQPPLSLQIRQLEEEVNVRLFERTKRWVRLTDAGQQFLPHARELLARVEHAVAATRQTSATQARFTVGCTVWADFFDAPRLIHRFAVREPAVPVELRTMDTAQQVRALKGGTLDMALLCPSPADAEIETEPFGTLPLMLAMPPGHRLAARPHIRPKDLAAEAHVALSRDVALDYWSIVNDYWRHVGMAVKPRLEADQPSALLDLIAGGVGVALVPAPIPGLDMPQAVWRPLVPAPPVLKVSLAWLRSRESPASRALVDLARASKVNGNSLSLGHGRAPKRLQLEPTG